MFISSNENNVETFMQHCFHCDDKHEGRSPYYCYFVIISSCFDAIAYGAIKFTVGLEWKLINQFFDWTKRSTEIVSLKQRFYKLVKQVY